MSVYDYNYTSIGGKPVRMSEYEGKQAKRNFTKFLTGRDGRDTARCEQALEFSRIAPGIRKLPEGGQQHG